MAVLLVPWKILGQDLAYKKVAVRHHRLLSVT